MVKKSEEERKLEKEVVELKKKGEELGVKDRKLKAMQYSRRLKMALIKSLGISLRDLEPDRCYPQYAILTNAVLDQIVEIIFDIFPNFKHGFSLDFHSCLQVGSLRMATFDDEEPGRPGSERLDELNKKSGSLGNKLRFKEDEELKLSREDLKTLDLSRDDLMRIVFTAVIQTVVKRAFPVEPCGSMYGGGSIH